MNEEGRSEVKKRDAARSEYESRVHAGLVLYQAGEWF